MTGFWSLVPCSNSGCVSLLDEWLGASHWRFQCFEFLVSKMRIVKVLGLPKWYSGKEYACQCRRCWRCRFNPWIRRSPGGGNDNLIHCSCLENSMDRGAWRSTIHGVTKSRTRLSTHNKSTYQGSLRELVYVKLLNGLHLRKPSWGKVVLVINCP